MAMMVHTSTIPKLQTRIDGAESPKFWGELRATRFGSLASEASIHIRALKIGYPGITPKSNGLAVFSQ